jgi:hypothetical protein
VITADVETAAEGCGSLVVIASELGLSLASDPELSAPLSKLGLFFLADPELPALLAPPTFLSKLGLFFLPPLPV